MRAAGGDGGDIGQRRHGGLAVVIVAPCDDGFHRRRDDTAEQHLIRLRGHERIRCGGEPLVGRDMLEAVDAVVEPDAEADIRDCRKP